MPLEEEDIHTDKTRISKGRKEEQEECWSFKSHGFILDSVFHYLMLLNSIQETVRSRQSCWGRREKGSNEGKKES